MSQLSDSLNKLADDLTVDANKILSNPRIKAEMRAKRLVVELWNRDCELAIDFAEDKYSKSVFRSFCAMLTYQHPVDLTMDEFVSFLYILIDLIRICAEKHKDWIPSPNIDTTDTKYSVHAVMCVETGAIYDSAIAAARAIEWQNRPTISDCVNNPELTAGGYHWTRYRGL